MANQNQLSEDGGLGYPDTRPCFYKIIWFANTIDLRIPPAFKHHLPKGTKKATLKTPTGNWDVKLLWKKDGVYLDQGWQEFLNHNSLGSGELLVFKYNGNISFEVVIFDKNGSKRTNTNTPPPPQESASAFTSSFPFFTQVIKKTNIGRSCVLHIPKKFQEENLPLSTQTTILRDPMGTCWPVNISICNTKFLGMCGGWKDFADANLLNKGDVCIFELVDQDSMQVHIFRHT